MPVSGSTYPDGHGYYNRQLVNLGGLTGKPDTISPATLSTDDPSARNGATLGMMPHWEPINICVGGTKAIRDYSERIIPREPAEDDNAYNRLQDFCFSIHHKRTSSSNFFIYWLTRNH